MISPGHTTNKDCKINQHIPQICKQLDPKDYHRECTPNPEEIIIGTAFLHVPCPKEDKEDKDQVKPVCWVGIPDIEGFQGEQTDELDDLAQQEVATSHVQGNQLAGG